LHYFPDATSCAYFLISQLIQPTYLLGLGTRRADKYSGRPDSNNKTQRMFSNKLLA